MKSITLVGSTGSIGKQVLDVVRHYPGILKIYALVANNHVELLARQAKEFLPKVVIIGNESKYQLLKAELKHFPIEVLAGEESVSNIVKVKSVSIVFIAIVGFVALQPTINAIKAGKTIALANKEVLVLAGELIMNLVTKYNATILPVDSEHSAIFQCLIGEKIQTVDRLILTASGGPFRTYSLKELKKVTKKEALQHPNWSMGDKVTIDSATLMNKGLEFIEAKWLFRMEPIQVKILIHPQSIIHSMVQFKDNSIKAQLALPDMHLPIQYALTFPERLESIVEPLDLENFSQLTFENPDINRFRHLNLAFEAIEKGGNMPCILNASNEVVVNAFLQDQVPFFSMSYIIEKTMQLMDYITLPSYEDLIVTDKKTRIVTLGIIKQIL